MGRKKKDLVPYEDYLPIKKNTPLGKFLSGKQKPIQSDKSLKEMTLEDSVPITWNSLGETAKGLYDTPKDAHDILVKYYNKAIFKQTTPETFLLCELIEKKRKKNKSLRSIIDENLAACCALIATPIEYIYPSKTYINQNPRWDKEKRFKKAHLDRDKIINQIVEKHRRLVIKNKKVWKQYLNDKI